MRRSTSGRSSIGISRNCRGTNNNNNKAAAVAVAMAAAAAAAAAENKLNTLVNVME
jgi:hypothetical protein